MVSRAVRTGPSFVWPVRLPGAGVAPHHKLRSGVRRPPLSCCLAAALLVLSAATHADHPLISDDTDTQGRGCWQLELNTDHTRVREPGRSAREREVNAELAYGLADRLDVAVNLPWLHQRAPGGSRERGVGDTTVLAKWRFYEDDRGWSLGVRPEVTLSTGSRFRRPGTGRATGSVTLLSTLERGSWTWLVNGGTTRNGHHAGARRNLWAVSTALLHAFTSKWTLAVDTGVARSPGLAEQREKYGLLGVIYHIDRDRALDVGWRRSLGAGAAAHTLGLGVTLRW